MADKNALEDILRFCAFHGSVKGVKKAIAGGADVNSQGRLTQGTKPAKRRVFQSFVSRQQASGEESGGSVVFLNNKHV